MKIAFKTNYGTCYKGDVVKALSSKKMAKYKGSINLIFFSPPFPLNRKKKYGNFQGDEYLQWLSGIGLKLKEFLSEDGSIVMEVGNSWESGKPAMSTLALRALLSFLDSGDYNLCQQFIWHNTAKLPSPAEWVTKRRIRVKDSFTHIWWMSVSDNPKADNRKILEEYSNNMKRLLKSKSYNSGKRPSEHVIGKESFLTNNKGAIPSNVIVASNTTSNSPYLKYCRKKNITPHPARMPKAIPDFFINFLTDENDLVFDPFGGSNTTGESCEDLKRKWISLEVNEEYINGSIGRFNNVL
ncbi:MAG: site-specific DNA-methyltransferase [Brumimicrobium sp.]